MRRQTRRPGFTLTEMLVVIGLILVLTSLLLLVNLRTTDQRKVMRAADQLQGWLLIAKQRAIRDRAPRGVMITMDPNTNTFSNLTYMEQPEPWTPALFNTLDPAHAPAAIRVPTWDRDLTLGTLQPTDPRYPTNMQTALG